MENSSEEQPIVHLHKGSTETWYSTVCDVKDTNIYVTLNKLFVTCDKCSEKM